MKIVSSTDLKQRCGALIDDAQRGPVMIRRHERDIAVLISAEEYERIRGFYLDEFDRFCDRVSAQAKERGLTEEILADILKD